jgi:radical SAM superfamily enzyme YgiQ (UPF0313 family)
VGAANTQPSFGLLCLAASARQAGAQVTLAESAASRTGEEACRQILQTRPTVVGISATTAGIVAAGELARSLKAAKPDVLTVVGGCHASALPEDTLRSFPALDLVVHGEGELTLVAILQEFERTGRVPSGLEGTAERTPNGIRLNPPRPLIANLDDLPFPAWDLLPGFPHRYRPSPMRIRRWPCASLVLTRGCPNRCTFCDRSVFGNRCRSHSPGYAVRMIRDLHDRYAVREFLLEDDTFIIRKDAVREFCERLIQERIPMTWSCLGRADRVDPELLRLMRRAGCWHIAYGIESGDPGILERVHKNLDLQQIRQAVTWSRQAGLRTQGFFMVGFPGETRETLAATRRLAKTLPLDDISVMQLSPFPGSELYETAADLGSFQRDWRKMNALNTVFVPNGLTAADLETARARLIREFYLQPRVLWSQARHMLSNPRTAWEMVKVLPTFLRVLRPQA